MSQENEKPGPQPISLGDQAVPEDRDALIRAHVDMLSQTARDVSDKLAFDADVADIIAVLEREPEDGAEERS